MNVGARVKQARQTLGWTQTELASRVGVGQATISALEKRDSSWTQYLVELATALGVSERWLSAGDGAMWRQPQATGTLDTVDPQIVEYILDAVSERDDPGSPLSNKDMAKIIAESYTDMISEIKDDNRTRVNRIVAQSQSIKNRGSKGKPWKATGTGHDES